MSTEAKSQIYQNLLEHKISYWIKVKGLCQAGLVVLRYSAIFLALRSMLDGPDAKQSSHVHRLLEESIHKDSDEGGIGTVGREETTYHPRTRKGR